MASIEAYDEQGGLVTSYWQALIDAINSVGHPPLTWAVQGLQSPQSDAAWMGDPRVSQYADWYWTYALDTFRLQYPWAASNYADLENMNAIAFSRLGYVQVNQPQLLLTQCTGPSYRKGVMANNFQPGGERIARSGLKGPFDVAGRSPDRWPAGQKPNQ